MILHSITPRQPLPACLCTRAPQLIEARGRVRIDARLFGKPARQYHVECSHCAHATAPVYSQRTAEALWRLAHDVGLTAIADLPSLRLKAEQQLAVAPIYEAA